MKKIILAVILSILPLTIFAQGLISFGPKVGWNSNRLTTDYTQYINDGKSGLQGGLFFSLYINKFYIQPEAYFSIKRGALQTSYDPLHPSVNISQSVNLKSIDFPLLLGFKLFDLKLIRFRIWGGPVASYMLSKEYTLSMDGIDHTERITTDDFKNAVWSVTAGAGLDLLMLTFDIGYEYSLNSFLTIRSLDDFNLRNNLFYCSIGWRLF